MINVLDHGYVRLVSYMQPALHEVEAENVVGVLEKWTGDLEIVRNARTSYNADWRGAPSQQELDEGRKFLDSIEVTSDEQARVYDRRRREAQESKDEKLINYLYEHAHTSPFEAMVFTFEVQAPIFVFRQWHRHRTWSYNEVSARYTELPELFYVPKPEHIGYQDKKNKQGREGEHEYSIHLAQQIHLVSEHAHREYRQMLETGISRELARLVLPVNTYSRMFATVDLHNLFHFMELRLDPHAQYEIRVYADALLQLAESICPVACEAFRTKIGYLKEKNNEG